MRVNGCALVVGWFLASVARLGFWAGALAVCVWIIVKVLQSTGVL